MKPENLENVWVVEGEMSGDLDVRHTPAGLPVTRFKLRHQSHQWEAGTEREVTCTVNVVAFGEALQRSLTGLREGDRLRVTGFAAQAGYRRTHSLMLHAQRIERPGHAPRSDRNAIGD